MLSAIPPRTTSHELCHSEPTVAELLVGGSNSRGGGVRRRHSASSCSLASPPTSPKKAAPLSPQPLLGRAPGSSSPTPQQRLLRPGRPKSPQATRGVGSPRVQQQQQRPSPIAMGAARGSGQPSAAPAGLGPTSGVRRGTSAPFTATAFVASRGTKPETFRCQANGLAARV